jgi:hypothetical protein
MREVRYETKGISPPHGIGLFGCDRIDAPLCVVTHSVVGTVYILGKSGKISGSEKDRL